MNVWTKRIGRLFAFSVLCWIGVGAACLGVAAMWFRSAVEGSLLLLVAFETLRKLGAVLPEE
jgi:hypothetical protein